MRGKVFSWSNEVDRGDEVLWKCKEDVSLFAHYFFRDPFREQAFVPYAWQDAVFNDPHKRVVVCTGRQIGKTTVAALKALHFAFFNDESTVLVISKTFPQSLEVIKRMNDLLNRGRKIKWDSLKPKDKESRAVIRLKNSGKKTFSRVLSVPATDAARGYSADLVIPDEAPFWENGDYIFNEVVMPTIHATNGKAFVIGTPNGRQGFFYNIFKSEFWHSYQYDWRANPNKTEEDMESIRASMTKLQFAAVHEAEFVSPKDAYFSYDEVMSAVQEIDGEVRGNVVISADFGKIHDYSVIMVGCVDNPLEDPKDWVIKVIARVVKKLGTKYSSVLGEIRALQLKYGAQMIIVDATGVGEAPAEFLKSEGLPVEAVKFSIQKKADVYGALKMLFEQRRIRIPNEKVLIDQLTLMNYEYTINGNIKIFPPGSEHDDEADSLALLAYGLTISARAAASIEVVEKPVVVTVRERPRLGVRGGERLIFCEGCDGYHWDRCVK